MARPQDADGRGSRTRRWLLRYGPAEAAGSVAAMLVLMAVDRATGSTATAAYAAAAAEGVAYYGSTFLRDWRGPDVGGTRTHARGALHPLRVMRHLLREFGGAELLDLLVLRPLCLGIGLELVGGAAGALGGKIAADLAFYAQVVTMYERRRLQAR